MEFDLMHSLMDYFLNIIVDNQINVIVNEGFQSLRFILIADDDVNIAVTLMMGVVLDDIINVASAISDAATVVGMNIDRFGN